LWLSLLREVLLGARVRYYYAYSYR